MAKMFFLLLLNFLGTLGKYQRREVVVKVKLSESGHPLNDD
jgi:hypothetical protein